ncbi:RNase adapter RapZ [Desulfovibrio fairfieldensis]|uniref:RNase adaptor protein RapZ n=1 Tax=Desulfovibrio fairfieldensis TaxID=44742 RepID=A0A109W426_9BACT|nr:RNase adapter RapZ [Desulfovibrio fairfieldensis]AMD89704.1 RNase adaptor protein RapZ [Desulfovibrio fairfieldensis]GKI11053.1 nucleotide-binding protein [Desulfovibrionaceae bacterium]
MSTSQQPPCRSPSDPDSSADTPKVAHDRPVQVCIVTGLSGAGKSTAVQVFEDLRYFAVDGLPASLAPEMAAMMERPSMSHFMGIALGMDMRQSNFPDEINDALSVMAAKGIRPLLLFLEADAQELMRRYATTRRPHPLEREGMGLEAALAAERNRLRPLREMADLVIDTSRFSIHDLRRSIQKRWSGNKDKLRAIRVNVISFGFKYGVPREADTVFDLRFLPNPYFVEELRPLCGKDKAVADYVFASPSAVEFRKKLLDLLFFMLPLMEAEGRYRITIAVGCTGGRHRSVAMAEELSQALRQADYPTSLEHRHLELG